MAASHSLRADGLALCLSLTCGWPMPHGVHTPFLHLIGSHSEPKPSLRQHRRTKAPAKWKTVLFGSRCPDNLVAVLGGGRGEPAPEAPRHAAEDGDVVTLRRVRLPKLHPHMGDRAGHRTAGREGAGVEIDGEALGQHVAGARPADPDHRPAAALIRDGGKALEG